MGGIGSGRRMHYEANETTNNYRSIDVRNWYRDGLLKPNQIFMCQWSRGGKTFAAIKVRTEINKVILTYSHRSPGGEWEDENYPVQLDWTACNFGGERPWFLCPAEGCGRRVAVLYGNGVFACRHCYQLAYPSQRELEHDRATRLANRIREKLGWEPGIFSGKGSKPKGMHWYTFERLTAQYDAFVAESLAGTARRLGLPCVY